MGISLRIALAAASVALVAVVIVAVGVWVVGSETFTALMVSHGEDAVAAHTMFDEAISRVLLVAVAMAIAVAVVVAAALGSRIGRPVREAGLAARHIADGNYSARLKPRGAQELVSLAESFNQMAAGIEEQERIRREFIANAAHELRTPLTNLQGYLEALRDSVIAPDRRIFESLWEEADRLVRLSRSLDQLAGGDRVDGTSRSMELDLGAALRTAVELARPAAVGGGLMLEVDAPTELKIHADPDRVAQVMANLLDNAVRYTPHGGHITVHAEQHGAEVIVSVVNTGVTIPAGDLQHIFERFYRVDKSRDRQRGGAGIGLAIVRQLIESSGGKVGAESSAGMTRLWVSLPSARP